MGNEPEKLYTFNWRFWRPRDFSTFRKLQKIAIINGTPIEAILNDLVAVYVEENSPKFTPVTEKFLLSKLQEKGFTLTRPMLKYYREKGMLENSDGKPSWYTNGVSIVYNLEETMKILVRRKDASSRR